MFELPQIAAEIVGALGLGVLVMAVVQVLKRLGVIPDGWGGSMAAILNIVILLVLTVGVEVFKVDLEGEQAVAVLGVLKLIGELMLAVLTSVTTFGKARAANVYGFRADGKERSRFGQL